MTKEQLTLIVSGVCSSITLVNYKLILGRLDDIDNRLNSNKLLYIGLSNELREAYNYYMEFMPIINPKQFNKYVRS